ncbi:hypothetical protein, partial [Pantoea agglomerans]|uniref:hypothetical protein n=1 Tax=Enterobacter agglomerans TaxID=549 RepID=UPI001CA3FA4F
YRTRACWITHPDLFLGPSCFCVRGAATDSNTPGAWRAGNVGRLDMTRKDLLKWIRRDGSGVIEQFLPYDARAEMDGVILDRRHEIDEDAFLMFFSIRALLRKGGMASYESDQEAGQIMALLKL